MPSRRGQITMTEEEQEAFLADAWTLQVASLGPSGWPHLVAMWFVVIDGVITFTTFAKSQKIVNLKRDAKITCMAESGTKYAELRGLVVEGEAEVTDEAARAPPPLPSPKPASEATIEEPAPPPPEEPAEAPAVIATALALALNSKFPELNSSKERLSSKKMIWLNA